MKFDETNKVIIETLNENEARAFVQFLRSEIIRHKRDVAEAEVLIVKIKERFGWN